MARRGWCVVALSFVLSVVAGQYPLFAASDHAVLAPAVDARGKGALKELLEYYQSLKVILERLGDGAPEAQAAYDVGRVQGVLRVYGWPPIGDTVLSSRLLSKSTALLSSDMEVNRTNYYRTKALVFDALGDLGNALEAYSAQKRVTQLLKWPNVHYAAKMTYNVQFDRYTCELRSNHAYRTQGSWAVGAVVTNDNRTYNLRPSKRLYLTEALYFNSSNRVVPSRFLVDLQSNKSRSYWGNRPVIEGKTPVTSIVTEDGGPSDISFVKGEEAEDNLAIAKAIISGDSLTRQGLDARTWTSTIIIALPLPLAILPAPLFMDVGNRAMLVYMFATDVLAVLPLAIKGVELIDLSKRRWGATETVFYGQPWGVSTSVATTWSCKCQAQGMIQYGAVFLAVAITASVVGISLEVLALTLVKRNKRLVRRALRLTGEEEYVWERTFPCDECKCYQREQCALNQVKAECRKGLVGQTQLRREQVLALLDAEARRVHKKLG